MKSSSISYKGHRFPPQILSHAVWLYARFNLSLRKVEEMLLQRGIEASYETVRRWVIRFRARVADGDLYADVCGRVTGHRDATLRCPADKCGGCARYVSFLNKTDWRFVYWF